MQAAHARAMKLALERQGVASGRALAIVALYKKRRRKLKPINRDRRWVRQSRTAFAELVKHVFDTQRPRLAAQISQLIARTAKADGDRVESILGDLDFDGWVTLIVDGEKILVHIAIDGSGEAQVQLGKKLAPAIVDQVNDAAKEWAKERAAELVGKRYEADGSLVDNPKPEWAITESTRELLRGDVARAIEEGMSPAELAGLLEESYTFSEDRAMAIARTEIAGADIQGSLLTYRESGLVSGKELILSDSHGDPDECDDAAAMGTVPIDDDFGGLGDPPYHPNCECDVLPVLAEEGDEG